MIDGLADRVEPCKAVTLGLKERMVKPMRLFPMIPVKVAADCPDGKDEGQAGQVLPTLSEVEGVRESPPGPKRRVTDHQHPGDVLRE